MKRMQSVLTVVLMALLSVVTPAGPVRAQTGAVVLNSVTPAVPRSTDRVTLSGTVVNDSQETWNNITLEIRIGQTPLPNRFQTTEWLKGQSRQTRLVRRITLESLASTQVTTWSISIPAQEFGLGTSATRQGVYPLLVTTNKTATAARSLFTWAPSRSGVKPTTLSALLPLTWKPSRVSDGRFVNTSILTDISATGRLTKLLDAGMSSGVTWLVDPSLTEALVDLADGAQVLENGEYRPVLAQEQQRATLILNRARTILNSANTYALPAGNADVVALATINELDAIRESVGRGQQIIARDLSVAPAGTAAFALAGFTNDINKVLKESGVDFIVTGSKAYPTNTDLSYTASSVLPNVAVTDADIDSLMATGAPVHDVIAAISMVTFELPQASRTLVISAPLVQDPLTTAALLATLSDYRSKATVVLAPLSAVQRPDSVARTLAKFPVDASAVTAPEQLRSIANLSKRISVLTTLMTSELDKNIVRNQLMSGVESARSVLWTTDLVAGKEFLNAQARHISDLEASIEVSGADRVMLSGERGVIPVTVRNGLPWPVNVALSATSSSAIRASITNGGQVLTIAPGEREGVELRVRVVGTGSVPVVIRALTTDGQAIGKPISVQVGSAAYARVATYVVFGAFVLLFLLVLRTTFKRLKKKAA